MFRHHRIRLAAGAALACCLALATGCAGSDPAATGADGRARVRISSPANVSNVPLHIAMENGYFAQEGLDIAADVDLGAGSTIESVIGGQVDMAWTNVVSALNAYGKGLRIRLVAVTDLGVDGAQQLLVPKDSPARELKDLVGKKVAVLSPNTICIVSIRAALKALGLPQDSIAFTPVAPPEHATVLSSGEVAGTCTSDPFRTLMIEELGARPVLDATAGELAGHLVGGYVVSDRFAAANPGVLAGFQRALVKAAKFANADPGAVRAALPKFTTIDAKITDRVAINKYVETDLAATKSEVQRMAELMRAYGLLDKPLDVSGFLLPGTS
ncbi:ABC transporter substrate-binding protein [Nocardia sp. NPDC052566]|uniref:ABC transporter substrate-binding protein n=1 Tax=Nocardia sp. NPDC052566 TaxID=3364330 RepID=UPI0037C57142